MTGSPIDASLRRPILPTKDRGTEVPDSRQKLAPSPQLIMEAGAVRPNFRFDDGDGLTDAFGNKYDGYGNAGGDSFVITHQPPEDLDDEIDDADDEDLIQYNGAREKWEKRNYVESQLMKLTNTITPVDLDIALYNAVGDFWEPVDRTELAAALDVILLEPAQVVSLGEMLVANASGEFTSVPQISPDFISGIIREPEVRTYVLVQELPYDITITGNVLSIAAGSISVTFPSGTITAGNPIEIIVTAIGGGTNEYARIQLNFTRNLLVS